MIDMHNVESALTGAHVPLTVEERRSVIAHLTLCGLSEKQIAHRLKICQRMVGRDRQRNQQLWNAWNALTDPDAATDTTDWSLAIDDLDLPQMHVLALALTDRLHQGHEQNRKAPAA